MSNQPATLVGIAFFILLFCGCPVAAQLFEEPGRRAKLVHAYEGPLLPATKVATVFVRPFERLITSICEINGKKYFSWLGCGEVVYLLPGTHQLTIRYSHGWGKASTTIPIRVEAGKTYLVFGTIQEEGNAIGVLRRSVTTSMNTMPADFVLTYKDIYPSYYAQSGKPNARVNPADAK